VRGGQADGLPNVPIWNICQFAACGPMVFKVFVEECFEAWPLRAWGDGFQKVRRRTFWRLAPARVGRWAKYSNTNLPGAERERRRASAVLAWRWGERPALHWLGPCARGAVMAEILAADRPAGQEATRQAEGSVSGDRPASPWLGAGASEAGAVQSGQNGRFEERQGNRSKPGRRKAA
jgi:hypothetical protein